MILARLRALLGDEALVGTGTGGQPIVAPREEAGVALVLESAAVHGWHVGILGGGGWSPADCPADLLLSTRRLGRILELSPGDLVVVAEAGVPFGLLRAALAEEGMWAALDHPGCERTLGSLTATATAGPLRSGFGAIRDHLLGTTFVTGDGQIVRPGGKVVKNVAGYDLTKLVAGSFGAFGIVTTVTLRLRALPRADLTLLGSGSRSDLLDSALAVLDAGLTPAALEVLSPDAGAAPAWQLAVRITGRGAEAAATRDAVRRAASIGLTELPPEESAALWDGVQTTATSEPVSIRIAALPAALETCLDQLEYALGESWIAASVGAGVVRWTGEADAEALRRFRYWAATQEMPLTLERAPWPIRSVVGHFGAYREGTSRLVTALRHAFDPHGVLLTPVGADA
jgi:glycolate oxidase FAD binding subunit